MESPNFGFIIYKMRRLHLLNALKLSSALGSTRGVWEESRGLDCVATVSDLQGPVHTGHPRFLSAPQVIQISSYCWQSWSQISASQSLSPDQQCRILDPTLHLPNQVLIIGTSDAFCQALQVVLMHKKAVAWIF